MGVTRTWVRRAQSVLPFTLCPKSKPINDSNATHAVAQRLETRLNLQMNARAVIVALAVTSLGVAVAHYAPPLPDSQIAPPSRQFGLPFAGAPGVNTWLLGQLYGNTTGAYRRRNTDYRAGQGIHFGMDFSVPCGTPVRAIGDGVVAEVDGPHGSPPHNLVVNHAGNLSSLYGHLQRRSSLRVGQRVKRGDVIGVSGDSQFTCISAPHLHLEIRDRSHQRFFNPVGYMDADWDSLALVGSFGRGYQRDLANPRRWQTLQDQPQARRGGALLNNFAQPWPPMPDGSSAPRYPSRLSLAPRLEPAASDNGALTRLTANACCAGPTWSADSSRVLFIDKPGSDPAAIYGVSATRLSGARREINAVVALSPSGRIAVLPGAQPRLERLSDGRRVTLPTGAGSIAFSGGDAQVAWVLSGTSARFDTTPTRVYAATLEPNGFRLGAPRLVATLYGGGLSGWLGAREVLVTGKSAPAGRDRALRAINVSTLAARGFGAALNYRGISISPSGRWVAYYIAFDSAARNGMYVLDTQSGSRRKLNWLGSYRWRSDNRLAYIPLQLNGAHRLLEWNAQDGATRTLATLEGKVAGDDWQMAPNGSRIVYRSAADKNLYALELP
jgi:murein DD-endopeptidase MepM/ murein hydrolase activator NlpD